MSQMSDAALVARAQRGSEEAFRQLVDAYKERLFAFVWKLLRNHHEAEDICQSAFVKAYESLDSYSSQYAFSTWLFTIAYRQCLNHLRKRKATGGELELAQIGSSEPEASETLAGTEDARRLREVVWGAVDGLSAAQRTAVLLFYREGKSCQEIGTILGIPAVTVKSHLHRAREKLRGVFETELTADFAALRRLNDSSLR